MLALMAAGFSIPTPDPSLSGSDSTVALRYDGEWAADGDYQEGSVVLHGGVSYIHTGEGLDSYEPGTDPISDIELLTVNPFAQAQPNILASTLRDLTFWQGRLYTAFGDYGANTGPIDLTWYDVDNDSWHTDGQITGEQTRYSVVDSGQKIFVSGIDERGGVTGADYGRRFGLDDEWEFRLNDDPTGLGAAHVFEIAELPGVGLFAAGSKGYDAVVWFSADMGETWQVTLQIAPTTEERAAGRYYRFYGLIILSGRVYVRSWRSWVTNMTYDDPRMWSTDNGTAWVEQAAPTYTIDALDSDPFEQIMSYEGAGVEVGDEFIYVGASNVNFMSGEGIHRFTGTDTEPLFPTSAQINQYNLGDVREAIYDLLTPYDITDYTTVNASLSTYAHTRSLTLGDDGRIYFTVEFYAYPTGWGTPTLWSWAGVYRLNKDNTEVDRLVASTPPMERTVEENSLRIASLKMYDGTVYIGGNGGSLYAFEVVESPWKTLAQPGAAGSQGEPGAPGTPGEAGRDGATGRSLELRAVGAWDVNAFYQPNMIVQHGGGSWISTAPTSGNEPGVAPALTDHFLHPAGTLIDGAVSAVVPGSNWQSAEPNSLGVVNKYGVTGTTSSQPAIAVQSGQASPSVEARFISAWQTSGPEPVYSGDGLIWIRGDDTGARTTSTPNTALSLNVYQYGTDPALSTLSVYISSPSVLTILDVASDVTGQDVQTNSSSFAFPFYFFDSSFTIGIRNVGADTFEAWLDNKYLCRFTDDNSVPSGTYVGAYSWFGNEGSGEIVSFTLGATPWQRV